MHRTQLAPSARVDYVHAPLSLVMARYLSPFWLFRDASRGDRMARAAAYRHNRNMRDYLPRYIWRWTVQAAVALGLVFLFDNAAHAAGTRLAHGELLMVLTAGAGIAFACCICMLFVMSYVYVYFSRIE